MYCAARGKHLSRLVCRVVNLNPNPNPSHRMPAGLRRPTPQTSTCRCRGSRRTGCARARARCSSSCAGASRGASATRSTGARTPRSDGEAGCTSDTLAGIRRRTDPRAGPSHRDRRVASCGAGGCTVPCARIGRTIPTRQAQGLTRSRACVENRPDRAGQRGQSGWLADQGCQRSRAALGMIWC